MQSDRFLDATVSTKFNWGAAMEKVAGKASEKANKVKGTFKAKPVPLVSGRLKAKISHDETSPEDAKDKNKSRRFDVNEGLKTVGNTLVGIFKKPDNITNTTVIQSKDNEDDNTMLYVGIGGGVLLLVVLLIVFMK